MSRSCNWCFTINATETEATAWEESATPDMAPVWLFDAGTMKGMLYQLEKAPTTGQIHIQGFMITLKTQRMTGVAKMLPHAHLEVMKGSVKQNIEYCSKSDSKVAGPWTFGELPTKQGKRTDWSTVKEMADAGSKKKDILAEFPHLAPCVKGIEALIEASRPAPPISRDVQVWYLYGATGTGKTHRAYTAFPKAFKIRGKYFEGKSFDMYDGEEVLILDEWSPYEWSLTLMNTLLDKWETPLQCRYNNKYAYWTKVIICTNFKPEECYAAVLGGQKASFFRRLTHQVEILSQTNPEIDFINNKITLVPDDEILTDPDEPATPAACDPHPVLHRSDAADLTSFLNWLPPPIATPPNPRGDFSFRRTNVKKT